MGKGGVIIGSVGMDQNRQDTGFFIQSSVRLKTPIR